MDTRRSWLPPGGGAAPEFGQFEGEVAQHKFAVLVRYGASGAGRQGITMARLARESGLSYDTLMRLLRGQMHITQWQGLAIRHVSG